VIGFLQPAKDRDFVFARYAPTPELKHAPILGGINFLDAASMAAIAAVKERQMAQMVADALVGVPRTDRGSAVFQAPCSLAE
jgi:hypothetical protein